MTAEDFDSYVRELGYVVDVVKDQDGQLYSVVRGVVVSKGGCTGMSCDVGIARSDATPYVVPAAVHTKPALIPMGQRNTQASLLGADWQYLSRRYDRTATPRGIWTHILTVLGEI